MRLLFGLKIHNSHVGEYFIWPGPLRQSRLVPAVPTLKPPGCGNELALFYKTSCILNGQNHHLPAEAAKIVGPAASRKTNFGLCVGSSNISRIQVAVHVDLCAPKKGVVDISPLTCFHNCSHGGNHDGLVAGSRITDGNGHLRQLRTDASRFKHDGQVR